MIITGPAIDEIVFSRTAKNIKVTDIPAGVTFEVYFVCNRAGRFGFSARAYEGTYVLQLAEILKSLEGSTPAYTIPPGGCQTISPNELLIEFHLSGTVSASATIKWVPGYCRANSDEIIQLMNAGYWWTMRPQTAYTLSWSRETLQLAVPAGFTADSINIYADIHFSNSGKQRVLYQTIPYEASARMIVIDASYTYIESLALRSGYTDDTILAYDIVGSIGGLDNYPVGQRFIVAPKDRNIRGWYFRNSLGAFDTVYSFGSVSRAIESEIKTFTTNMKELEVSNISKETFSIDTGYIKNQKELNLWYEFLRSTERYAILSANEISRIIVDDSDSKKTLNEVGGITFRCRMSEEVEGYGFTKTRLEDFSDGFT